MTVHIGDTVRTLGQFSEVGIVIALDRNVDRWSALVEFDQGMSRSWHSIKYLRVLVTFNEKRVDND